MVSWHTLRRFSAEMTLHDESRSVILFSDVIASTDSPGQNPDAGKI
jgi:hypothetical protein